MPTLVELEREALACSRCPLAGGRTNVVFGVGDPQASLMFVGEGPGREEDLQGEPFVGRSGQLLDRLMREEIGMTRAQAYIANVVKCLRYNARVQLGDGSWERVGRLVRQRYDGLVMSVDEHGCLVRRRVTGWHASPLGDRRVFKLSYRTAKSAGASRIGVELTGDHPVLTERGFVEVQDLRADDRVAVGHGLSRRAFDVVCGSLLGDAHLAWQSTHLAFTHTASQRSYALFKAEMLAELVPRISECRVAAVAGGPNNYDVVAVRTLAHRSLRSLRDEFYAPHKVVPAWLATRLTARMLAVWFMDDGHLRVRPPRQPSAEIATCAFSSDDLNVLVAGLAILGVDARARDRRLHFDVHNTEVLSRIIAPYVPSAMRYKLHPAVAASVPFNQALWDAESVEVFYEQVEVEDVTENRRTDTTFFCIDVEGTHNFVTAGGVVHNCRPPGNRDPKPDEIEACRPFLESQVDLIQPTVVITLGNFATRLLLERTEGVTKLRGQTYPFRGGWLVPTFHPSAALRGNPTALAGMRADFVRAKELLAKGRP